MQMRDRTRELVDVTNTLIGSAKITQNCRLGWGGDEIEE